MKDALVEDADITPTAHNRPTTTHDIVEDEGGEGGDRGDGRVTADQSGRVDTLRTAEINIERDRRDTLTSPISALLAESMADVSDGRTPRDPAAPLAESRDLTRRLLQPPGR